MRFCDWMALAAFWTTLVNGDTEKGISQDNNAYGTAPTRYYDTTIHGNTVAHSIPLSTLSSLIASPATTVNSLQISVSETDITRSDNLVDNIRGDSSVDTKLQSEIVDAEKSRVFLHLKIKDSKFSTANIENEESFDKPADPNYSNFDGYRLKKTDSVNRKIFGVSKNQKRKFGNNPSELSMVPTSIKHFQLLRRIPNTQFHLEGNRNYADIIIPREILNYTEEIITEKENREVIKQRYNVQSNILQMPGQITSGPNHISKHFNPNEMVIKGEDGDVNILGIVGGKNPGASRQIIQTEDERGTIKSGTTRERSDEHLEVVNDDANFIEPLPQLEMINNSSENRDDIQRVQSKDDTPIEQFPERMTNEAKFPPPLSNTTGAGEINELDGSRIPKLQHKVTRENYEKSIIQSTTRWPIKNVRVSTKVTAHPLRDTREKLITRTNISGNDEFPMTSAMKITELRTSPVFQPSGIENELNSSVPPTSPSKREEFTRAMGSIVSEQTPDTDSSVIPSVVTREIDETKNLQTYIIKPKSNPFVTSIPYNHSNSWDYDRYAVGRSKVNIEKDLSTVDRLINERKLLHSQVSEAKLNEITVESSTSQIIRPRVSKFPLLSTLPKVFKKLGKSLRSISSDYTTSAQTDAIDSAQSSPNSPSEKNPIDSIYDDKAHGSKFFIDSNNTKIVIHEKAIIHQQNSSFNGITDRMSWQTTNITPTTIYSDIRILDNTELENSTHVSPNQWPVKHSAVVEGDLVLGGLMMIHEREDTVTCGPVMPQGGIQALEAMLYTLDWLNKREIVPGVKIGAHILDDCDKDTYGLEMAVDFIKGWMCHWSCARRGVSSYGWTSVEEAYENLNKTLDSFDYEFKNWPRLTVADNQEGRLIYPEDFVYHHHLTNPLTKHGIRHSDRLFRSIEMNSRGGQITWPVKKEAVVEGGLVLGGLMMVHERKDNVTCGPVMPQGGIQALEAMLYTLDWVNKRGIVPGVQIGAHILDDCDKDTYGLEMAVDFIKGSISNIDGAEYHCNKTAMRKVISGVVGAASSVTSIQVANLLRLFRIPQVSFFSTSPELSNKQRFEYFTRTIPSDHYQVKAMVDIVRKMGWSYISIIYEESNYGIKAYEELEELLAKYQICIAIKEKLVKDSGVADETAYDSIVQKLLTKPRARGCIIFGSDQEVAGVMRAVRRCNATGAFSWIGSDGWSARGLVSNNNEPEVEGTLSVQPQANPVEGFEDYFLNLTVENNRRNPWFVEFWEDHFECRYPNSSRTPYNQKHTKPCTTKERLTKQNTAFEDQLQFVSDAVMAFAYAFRDMHAELCRGEFGLCDAMKPTKGTELLRYLRKVEFKGLTGDKFHFDKNGDGPARYNIIHFKQISPGQYKWIRVGQYLEGELSLNMSDIQFRLGNPHPPESVCSLPCRVGQAKKYVEGESCCWHCLDCTQYQIRHAEDQTRCVLCPQGTVPDETHSYCRDIPEEFLKPDSGWAIGAMSFSASGIFTTLFVGGVFLKNNDTPIVRASGRELSYILLTGILLCYLVTFTLVLKPTDIVCGIQRFAAGFCFTVVYAALLTKTNRIARIFEASKKSAKRPSFISPKSQLIICTMLVGVQILINAVWMVIDPAKARHHYPTREDNLLVCNSYIDASYMIAFTYPIILIVVCTVYAVLTRKIPEDFNESKHIGFTMYTTCVIWLAFVPLYFGTGNHVALRITSMSVTISLSASVTIACLFSPKLYIILIHPERNIRRGMGPFRGTTAKQTNATGRNNPSSMMATVTLTAVTCDQNKAVNKLIVTTNDCSTQSEQLEMETIGKKNGKPPAALVSRSTQTLLNNNGKEIEIVMSPVIKGLNIDEALDSVKSMNNTKIGNGPLKKNELPV